MKESVATCKNLPWSHLTIVVRADAFDKTDAFGKAGVWPDRPR
jgi:hypothetical protein